MFAVGAKPLPAGLTMKPRVRGVRRATVALEVTERDRQILMCVGVHRYMSAAQLAVEFFPSVDYARRRLRSLYDAGLLAVTLTSSNKPNIVSLTPDGVREVAQVDFELAATLRPPGTLRAAGLAHHLGIVDCRLYLAALAAAGGPKLLRWSNAESFPVGQGGRQPQLMPDGLAELAVGNGTLRLAVEFDANTEPLDVLRRKVERYTQAIAGDDVHELWFAIDAGELRLRNIVGLCAQAGIGDATRVMPLAHIVARPVRQPLPRVGGRVVAVGHNTVSGSDRTSQPVQLVIDQRVSADRMADRTPARRGS